MKAIPTGFLDGGAGLNRGHQFKTTNGVLDLPTLLGSIDAEVASVAAVQALTADDWNGVVYVGQKAYRWRAASLANDSTSQLSIRPTALGTTDPGRFELDDASTVILGAACTFATADLAVLYTVPVGFTLLVTPRAWWNNSIAWTGGSSSAIGMSSSNSSYATAGDLQGGAGGDLTAAMGAGYKVGSAIGTKLASSGIVILTGGDTILFNKIANSYTAGAGIPNIGVRRI